MVLSTDRHGHQGAPSEATLMKEAMKLAKNKGRILFLTYRGNKCKWDEGRFPPLFPNMQLVRVFKKLLHTVAY